MLLTTEGSWPRKQPSKHEKETLPVVEIQVHFPLWLAISFAASPGTDANMAAESQNSPLKYKTTSALQHLGKDASILQECLSCLQNGVSVFTVSRVLHVSVHSTLS